MPVLRLAFRQEGDYVNVYLAPSDTMTGATHLASLNLCVAEFPELFEQYKKLMTDFFTLKSRELDIVVDSFTTMPAIDEPGKGQ